MSKSIISAVVSFAMVALSVPALAAIVSDSVPASNAWHYDGYRVERLNFDAGVDGPISIGEHVLVAVPTGDTNYRDVYFLRNGGYVKVEDVPDYVISEANYTANDDRFVWAEQVESDSYYYDLIELDPTTGEKVTLLSDKHFNGAESVAVHVTGDDYYFTSTINFNDRTTSRDAEVYWYDPLERAPMVIEKFNGFLNEQMLDANEGALLTKVTFEGGEEQLWIHDGDDMWAIPDSWTVSHENIESAHYLSNGNVEFFRMYERFVYDVETNTTTATGDYLSWNHDLAGAVKLVDHNMVWLNPDAELNLSTTGEAVELGDIGSTGMFRLESDRLFYDADGTGVIYDLASGQETELDFVATDAVDDVIVGTNEAGDVIYYNTEHGLLQTVGFGGTPLISDETHVYWIGSDENIYEATIDPEVLTGEITSGAVKTADSNTVYLVEGKNLYTIPNEKVFYSHFDSFSEIQTVTYAKLSEYADAGEARLAIGTRVKLENDPKVYTVGHDGKLHWIISQAVAYNVYGNDWNQDIIEINLMDLVDYSFGTYITSEADAELI